MKSLIDSGSPFVILFSCLVVQLFFWCIYIYIYTYFIFDVLLNIYQQGYVVCNLFFWIFFTFYCVYHIDRKKTPLTRAHICTLKMQIFWKAVTSNSFSLSPTGRHFMNGSLYRTYSCFDKNNFIRTKSLILRKHLRRS